MAEIPKLKKKISAFLVNEEGKISKESLLKAGTMLSAVALGSALAVNNANAEIIHSNSLSVSYSTLTAAGTHGHHASHASHSSHGSCCFPAATMITTPTGKVAIQDIKEGDKVLSYDLKKKETKEAAVLGLESPEREGVYEINDGLIRVTNEHPFYTKKKDGKECWAAIDEEAVLEESPNIGDIMRLEVGDFIFNKNLGWVEIKSLKYIKGKIQTYNLRRIERYNNFFAEDFLVHNKGGWW